MTHRNTPNQPLTDCRICRLPDPETGRSHSLEHDRITLRNMLYGAINRDDGSAAIDRVFRTIAALRGEVENFRGLLAELLRLYDWRQELAKEEAYVSTIAKQVMYPDDRKARERALKKNLVKYGREKKAAWEAARTALATTSEREPGT